MDENAFHSKSTALIRRVREGDQPAWTALVDLHSPMVYSWCRRSGLLPDDAADIVQEVFLSVSRAIERFDHEGPNRTFRGWLRTITQNAVNLLYRQRQGHHPAAGGTTAYDRFREIPDLDSETSSSESSAGGQALVTLAHLRDGFEETTWQAFWLTAIDGLTSSEAADRLGMTPAAVRKAKSRVLKRLREELGDLE